MSRILGEDQVIPGALKDVQLNSGLASHHEKKLSRPLGLGLGLGLGVETSAFQLVKLSGKVEPW